MRKLANVLAILQIENQVLQAPGNFEVQHQ
jgi:hypothetical protein